MNRIKLLGLSLILTVAALIPAAAPAGATSDASQCFSKDCSGVTCPGGSQAIPSCNLQYCVFGCRCIAVS
jgi:hypothetical protein